MNYEHPVYIAAYAQGYCQHGTEADAEYAGEKAYTAYMTTLRAERKKRADALLPSGTPVRKIYEGIEYIGSIIAAKAAALDGSYGESYSVGWVKPRRAVSNDLTRNDFEVITQAEAEIACL